MMYRKYTSQEYERLGEDIFRGHTDLGCWSLLFRQPVAGLQIKDYSTNEWKWVKPQDATITVNAGDTLSLLTAGYIKSTIHRVAVPPKDQQHVDRLGVLYFSRPQSDLRLSTIESPFLQREGFTHNKFEASGNPVPTMEGVKSKLKTSSPYLLITLCVQSGRLPNRSGSGRKVMALQNTCMPRFFLDGVKRGTSDCEIYCKNPLSCSFCTHIRSLPFLNVKCIFTTPFTCPSLMSSTHPSPPLSSGGSVVASVKLLFGTGSMGVFNDVEVTTPEEFVWGIH